MQYLGIDVSKSKSRYVLLDNNGENATKPFTLDNNQKSFNQLLERFKELNLHPDDLLIGIEATGIWWENLYCFMTEQKFKVIVLNPHQTNKFREALRLKAKSLIQTAQGSIYSGRAKDARGLNLNILLTQVETFQNSIAQLDNRMNDILSPQNPDDAMSFPGANLLSIPGIGPKTLAAILSVVGTNGSAYPDGKSFIGYIGFFPQIYESGETRRDNIISRRGPNYIRRALYIAAVACLKHNDEFKALYDRKISQGKTAKQALICVAKKLAHLCLSMLKSGESYNPARIFMPA